MNNNYFDVVPVELSDIIISYLDNDNLQNFVEILSKNIKSNLNWRFINHLHFGSNKNIDQIEYQRFLDIEKLKNIFRLKETVDEVDKMTELNLIFRAIDNIPPAIASLKNLQILNLSVNRIKKISPEVTSLKNLKY